MAEQFKAEDIKWIIRDPSQSDGQAQSGDDLPPDESHDHEPRKPAPIAPVGAMALELAEQNT